ncbi:MAG: hypothetical protein ABI765_07590 [Gemmatimonadota bacterium]
MGFEIFRFATFVLFALLLVLTSGPGGISPYVLHYFLGLHVLNTGSHWLEGELHRRDELHTVREFSRLDPERRELALNSIWSGGARSYLRSKFQGEVEPGVEGTTERFPFPDRERRENSRMFWRIALFVLVVALAATGLFSISRSSRLVLLGLAAPALLFLTKLHRRSQHLRTILSVGPFALTLIDARGREQRLKWNQPLTIVNEPKRDRFVVRNEGGSESVMVDYDRVGLYRALDLIYEYGGFNAAAANREKE